MKRQCRLCSEWFVTDDPAQLVCDPCWDEEPEDMTTTRALERELSDPALKERLAAALAKRLEKP